MKICLIFHRDYPWDVRIEKVCKTLARKGNEVHLISNNTDRKANEEILDGIYIHRRRNSKIKKLNKIILLPAFFNPYWIFHIYKKTLIHRFDILIVRDLPLVLPAWIVGRMFNIPIIYDMAENYPAMWQIFRSKLKIPLLAKIIESIALRISDHVIVVVEESRERLLRKGIKSQDVSIVSNTPELDLFEENIDKYKKEIFQNNKINLLYIGYLTKLRGLDTVIKALPMIIKKEERIKLNIIGDGADLPVLKGLAKEIGVQEYVDFKGWIDFKYIPYIISKSDIGVVPHHSNEHTNTTIPNKIFDFMACGKPVIVSDARPLKRIVEETGCGVTFQAENSDDFSSKLIHLIKENERDQMGLRGKKAVIQIYNWDRDADNLGHIFKIVESRRG